MDKAPAFQFYPSDWLDVKVLRMSLAAQGAYIRWLCHMWRDSNDQCSIENSASVLARLVGVSEDECKGILREIQWPGDPIFDEKDGRLVSKRLQRVKKGQSEYKKAKAEAGRLGGKAKATNLKGSKLRSVRLIAARTIGTHTKEEWQEMLAFFGNRCVKCGKDCVPHKDHVIPIYQGGSDHINNLQPLCQPCNGAKGSDSTDWRLSEIWQGAGIQPSKWLAKPSSSSSSSSSPSSSKEEEEAPSSPMGLLLRKADDQGIIGKQETKRIYFKGWILRTDYTRTEQMVMDPWSRGKTLVEMQDHFFPKQKQQFEQSFAPVKTKCGNCGGTGTVAGDVKDGVIQKVPCRRCASERRTG